MSFNSGNHDWKKLIMVHHWPATVCKVSLSASAGPFGVGKPITGLCEVSSPRPLTALQPLLAGPQSWAFPAGHSSRRAPCEAPRDRDTPPQTGWLGTSETCSLAMPEARSVKRGCGQGRALPEAPSWPRALPALLGFAWRVGSSLPSALPSRGVSALCLSVSCKNPRDWE